MFSFKVDKQSDNSRLFEKKMNSACKILVIIEYKDTKMYFEVPKNFVHISQIIMIYGQNYSILLTDFT